MKLFIEITHYVCTNNNYINQSKRDPLSANCTNRNYVTIMADKRIVIWDKEGKYWEMKVREANYKYTITRILCSRVDTHV